jgi:hypothetical protein
MTDCTHCHQPLDESAEETIEQINKYAALPILPVCEECLKKRFNEMDRVR